MMTVNNSFKKAVRTRMEITGEPFSVAKRYLDKSFSYPTEISELDNLIEGIQSSRAYLITSLPNPSSRLRSTIKLVEPLLNNNVQIAWIEPELSVNEFKNRFTTKQLDNLSYVDAANEPSDFVSDLKALIIKNDIKVIVVDNLKLAAHNYYTNSGRSLPYLSAKLLMELKRITVEANVALIVNTPLHRNAIFNQPFMYEASELETTADVVMQISVNEDETGFDLNITKNRSGSTGKVNNFLMNL
jgi:predicted ATP-dependent serine protease